MLDSNLFQIKNLKKYYPINAGLFQQKIGEVKAVDGVSLDIRQKETLGLVGESGCGKSTMARLLLKLEKPTAGEILYRRKNLESFKRGELIDFRKEVQIIFQDPQSSLDPRMTIGESLEEALMIMSIEEKARAEKIGELLRLVGLETTSADKYPHEFSGGEKQRIGIARAMALNPRIIIADEPVSALDVSIQAQVLNLMADLQERLSVTYLFIAHDLAVVKHISNRIAVMYLGKIVEMAETDELFINPAHPYTKLLLSSILSCNPNYNRELQTAAPDRQQPTVNGGCRFQSRCSAALQKCAGEEPPEKQISEGHLVSCHLYSSTYP